MKDAGDGTYTVRSTNSRVSTQGGREACALKAADVTLTLAGTGMRPSERFGDVPAGAWYSDAVDFVVRRGLFSGTGEDTFSPEANMTRAMLVTVLWRWEGKPQTDAENRFRDVKSGAWYTDAVRWASAQGIVTGYDEQTFGPDDSVTRQQMAAILCRWAGSRGYATGESGELSGYRDKDEIAPWALTAMGWACGAGLITGRTADTLSPNGTATRAEVATVFTRLCRIITGGQI